MSPGADLEKLYTDATQALKAKEYDKAADLFRQILIVDENYRDAGSNLFQVNVAGRLIQIEFRATDAPTSTEQYRVPYIMQGEVRCLNQEAIERAVIPEHLLFYCLEKDSQTWLLFDPRTHRTSDFDQECLISLLERLV